ncbi:hypothetical protein CRYUN_Cryun06bG0064800 [Craigia yunnanensis]
MGGEEVNLCDGESNDLRGGICPKHDLDEVYDPKIRSCRSGSLKLLDNCKELVEGDTDDKAKCVVEEDNDEKKKVYCPEDEEFDVMALRKLVKIERRTKAACQELEEERIAAASAADEAISMILRLQSEKNSMEIDANCTDE